MKWIFLILIIIGFSFDGIAQNEFLNKKNSFAPVGNNLITPSIAAPSVFKLNTKPITSSKSILETNTLQFTNPNNFKNPGDIYKEKLNRKVGEDESKIFRKNEYLGDFKSRSTFVKISYRDFGEVDGDLIRVLVNDKEVQSRVFLEGNFKGFELNLEKGFNKIDFEALNQGYSGPNTAEFKVYDDQGMLVSANQWNLATGFKATIIIVKE
ncbi:hypothetical protein [Flavobacterium psychrotolerans]|uniref:Secreted protein n=1 Tax=Flavobacterium psychrotolerans TaxID=2169410 RepID=A0A2U1JIP7_9FLAO|nr:hypothetical protein [Flavobacterium psychrotolerans]PWA05026.1 hypothetical protein DB895_08295 [Flavobacterium psychrotolerans]